MVNNHPKSIEVLGSVTYGIYADGPDLCSVTTNGLEGGDMSDNDCELVIKTNGHLIVKCVEQTLFGWPHLRLDRTESTFTVFGSREELETIQGYILENDRYPGGLEMNIVEV